MENDDIFNGLKRFNLSNYEIKAYSCLLLEGPLTATEVIKRSGIPQPRIYDVFSSLQRRGLVSSSSGLKKLYQAVSPYDALRKEVDSLSNYLTQLDSYVSEHKNEREVKSPNIWIVDSMRRTSSLIESSIKKASHEIIASVPYKRLGIIMPWLKDAHSRGVTSALVLFDDVPESMIESLSKISVIKRRTGSPPEILLIDRTKVMVNVGSMIEGEDYSLWMEESEIVHIVTYYFYYSIWQVGTYVTDFSIYRDITMTTSWLTCEAIDTLLLHGKTINCSVEGFLKGERITLNGRIIKTDREPGIRHGFIVEDEETCKTYSVGGRNAKIEDVRMYSIRIRIS
ncbi:MAG: TrmB family transcriptional regulator [Candidatus Thermoplasmatota archaeon]|nr:TrmB family transcriptional regulator [Candidatus Thermoplasmatota archaeon]